MRNRFLKIIVTFTKCHVLKRVQKTKITSSSFLCVPIFIHERFFKHARFQGIRRSKRRPSRLSGEAVERAPELVLLARRRSVLWPAMRENGMSRSARGEEKGNGLHEAALRWILVGIQENPRETQTSPDSIMVVLMWSLPWSIMVRKFCNPDIKRYCSCDCSKNQRNATLCQCVVRVVPPRPRHRHHDGANHYEPCERNMVVCSSSETNLQQ